jgi:hypothetical protein
VSLPFKSVTVALTVTLPAAGSITVVALPACSIANATLGARLNSVMMSVLRFLSATIGSAKGASLPAEAVAISNTKVSSLSIRLSAATGIAKAAAAKSSGLAITTVSLLISTPVSAVVFTSAATAVLSALTQLKLRVTGYAGTAPEKLKANWAVVFSPLVLAAWVNCTCG